MILSVYKQFKRGDLKVVANIELLANNITVHSIDSMVMKIINVSLSFPTKRKIVMGKAVIKKEPRNSEENLRLTLKQNVTKPYFISDKFEKVMNPKYHRTYDVSLLTGGSTVDRRVQTGAIA